jgi:DNA-binding transcriptional LysR family regulator
MDMLHAMKLFQTVAEEQSFSAAARKRGVAPSVVTRTINGLEDHLGTVLMIRSTRQLRLTPAGERYLENCRNLLSQFDAVHDAFSEDAETVSGTVRLTAPHAFGHTFVQPRIIEYLDANPDMRVCASYTDRVEDVVGDHLDVAIRIGELQDSNLRAIRLGWVCRVLCAAPLYLCGNPAITEPGQLRHHRIIAATTRRGRIEWGFDHPTQEHVTLEPHLAVSDSAAAIDATLAGWGITRAHSYKVAALIAQGKLVRLIPEYEPPSIPIHLLHPYGARPPKRVRSFIDDLVSNLRSDPTLQYGQTMTPAQNR